MFSYWQWGHYADDHRGRRVTVRPEGWSWLYLPKPIRKGEWGKERVAWHNDYGLLAAVPAIIVSWSLLIPWLGPLAVVLAQLCAAIVAAHCGYKPLLGWLRDKRISEGRCGGCKYALNGIDPEPDVCTVCPECGAAWKLGANADDR